MVYARSVAVQMREAWVAPDMIQDCGHDVKYYCTRCGGCYRCDHEVRINSSGVVAGVDPTSRVWLCRDGVLRESIQEQT